MQETSFIFIITSPFGNLTVTFILMEFLNNFFFISDYVNTITIDKIMDKIDERKSKTQTPRRIGLSRISKAKDIKPNRLDVNLKLMSTINATETTVDTNYSETRTKRTKTSSTEDITNLVISNKLPIQDKEQYLKTEISQLKEQLAMYKKFNDEKMELKRLIEMWCNSGKDVLSMLQEQIQPKQEIEQILTHFNLSTDIFN